MPGTCTGTMDLLSFTCHDKAIFVHHLQRHHPLHQDDWEDDQLTSQEKGKLLRVVHSMTIWRDLLAYSRIFEVLHSKAEELGLQLNPAKFVCDFETALIAAIQGNFPNIWVQGSEAKSKNANGLSIVTVGFEILKCDIRSSGRSIVPRERLPAPKILLLNVHSVAVWTNNHLEG
ncbi:hypothetical protein T01_11103 [Trichinella spiralis]|uniref:Uncharacterized protein n=1 Tax=Trichinella spiralis TaxID=6334 RepID=A0A0V1BU20_TRISP|nr:hypothetical protein T01_11103 [Trichinella spiralis]